MAHCALLFTPRSNPHVHAQRRAMPVIGLLGGRSPGEVVNMVSIMAAFQIWLYVKRRSVVGEYPV
ncbi:hypothetical protein [Bradyrhizobium sp. AZCC 1693]|uniref:hypothetical protein n=1 Tax=Bradyrhizobium sp. AZCC 1693 TaxID=3117029 RepID=UPI002FF30F46